MEYFYDQQYRRYILQFIRIFSDLKIQVSPGVLKRVPVKYGDMSRMVAMIMRDNSQNTILSAPQMSAWITGIEMSPERRKDTTYIRKTRAVERAYDNDLEAYTTESGNRYSIESPMPVPYVLNMQLDIWTTNTTDKFQILEQISTIFNPSVQIQTTDNPLDWTSIFEVELTGITWSNRSIPAGTQTTNDIASLTFKIPVWITPPARVSRQKMIQTIITNVFAANVEEGEIRGILDPLNSCFDRIKQFVVTPDNIEISVVADEKNNQVKVFLPEGNTWSDFAPVTGNVELNGGLLTLKTDDDIESTDGDVIGTVTAVENQDYLLFEADMDTVPTAVFNIDAVIDPVVTYPNNGLPTPQSGQKYLLVDTSERNNGEESIIPENDGLNPWGTIAANVNDIIEYNGTNWVVVFDSQSFTGKQYIKNISNSQHYVYQGGEWSFTYIGNYTPGFWRLEV